MQLNKNSQGIFTKNFHPILPWVSSNGDLDVKLVFSQSMDLPSVDTCQRNEMREISKWENKIH